MTLGTASAYEVNGKQYAVDPIFQKAKQTATVTVDAKEMPLEECLAEISKQSGWKIEWMGFSEEAPAVTFQSKDAPVLHVLAEIARANQLRLDRREIDQNDITLRKEHPVLSYADEGPILVTWHGRVTSQEFDFSDPVNPPKAVEVTKYRMSLFRDVDVILQTYEQDGSKAHRNRPVRIVLPDGTEKIFQSDHAPNTFGGVWQDWQFEPVAEFAGKKADISVTIPVSVSNADGTASQHEKEFVMKESLV